MTNKEWKDFLQNVKNEFYGRGRLDTETKKSLTEKKEIAVLEGYLTEEDRVLVARMLQTEKIPLAKTVKNAPQMRFGGRGGPRDYGGGEKPKNAKQTISRLVQYFTKEIRLLGFLFLFILVVVSCQVVLPRLQSQAIDKIDQGLFTDLPKLLLWMIGLFVVLSIFNLLQGWFSAILSQRIVKRMRKDLFTKLTQLPIAYFDTHSHGDIMSKMSNDIDAISNTLAQSLGSFFSGILMIIGTVLMMFITCWQLAILSCGVVLLTVITTKFISQGMRKFFTKRQILLGSLNGIVEEMVIGHKTVCAFSKEDRAIEDFAKTSKELTKTGIFAEILGGSMGPLMNVISNTGFVIIAAFGGYFAMKGIISVGIISAFIIYAKQFSRPINEIAQLYGQLQTALASSERVFSVFDAEDEDKSGEMPLPSQIAKIAFEKVDFSYEKEKQVLFGFDLEIKQGQKVALVGATGSGKTTVVNLLMRFYEIDRGRISIDKVDIKDIQIDDLRRNTAIVLQDTLLFQDTIRNNLKYANPASTDEEMIAAAKQCNCDLFIRQMKNGYDTMLSEGGSNLSQGQRQLLSIARAFLAQPKILILDEATSSVDTRTEKHIQDAMHQLMKNRTSLIIAHRLSTIEDADVIVVMDHGRIVEQGSHEELLAQTGKYYDLYMTQFKGYAL